MRHRRAVPRLSRGRCPNVVLALLLAGSALLPWTLGLRSRGDLVRRRGTVVGAEGGLFVGSARAAAQETVPVRVPHVLDVRPHDPGAFTQGLVLHEGSLYESTGRDGGEARLREVNPLTGTIVREIYLPPAEDGSTYWGEGLARVGDRLVQLTWRHGVAFDYDLATFAELRRFRYDGEGWGLCHDGERLVMSNGSNKLTFRDPETFTVLATVDVTIEGWPRDRLNELECVDGFVYANVFLTDEIVRIDPHTGAVVERIDASGLLTPEEELTADVLNGIAYDPTRRTFLLTGKWWPKLFEVQFVPRPRPRDAYIPLALRGR